MDNLDDFLKGSEQPEAEIEAAAPEPTETAEAPAPEATAEEPKGPVRDEKGRFAPKGEEGASPAPKEPEFDHAATLGERRRRQEAEARIAALEEQLQQLRNPPQPAPDIFENPDAWQGHFGSQVVNTAVQQATFNARLDMSEMMVRQSHPDFDDKKSTFLELMEQTPGLREKALNDPHPWNFAYNYVANHQRMNELAATNVTELEARLREQIKAELAAEQTPSAPTPSIPDTLADAQSARGAGGNQPLHVPSFNEILKR